MVGISGPPLMLFWSLIDASVVPPLTTNAISQGTTFIALVERGSFMAANESVRDMIVNRPDAFLVTVLASLVGIMIGNPLKKHVSGPAFMWSLIWLIIISSLVSIGTSAGDPVGVALLLFVCCWTVYITITLWKRFVPNYKSLGSNLHMALTTKSTSSEGGYGSVEPYSTEMSAPLLDRQQ